jgi:hypothetical protein
MMAFEAGQRAKALEIANGLQSQRDLWAKAYAADPHFHYEKAFDEYIETLTADPATPESTATWQGIDADEFVGEMRREGGGENEHTR